MKQDTAYSLPFLEVHLTKSVTWLYPLLEFAHVYSYTTGSWPYHRCTLNAKSTVISRNRGALFAYHCAGTLDLLYSWWLEIWQTGRRSNCRELWLWVPVRYHRSLRAQLHSLCSCQSAFSGFLGSCTIGQFWDSMVPLPVAFSFHRLNWNTRAPLPFGD